MTNQRVRVHSGDTITSGGEPLSNEETGRYISEDPTEG